MTEAEKLWEYQIQLRRIAAHREAETEAEIRREYLNILEKLQTILAKYYAEYGDPKTSVMTNGDLLAASKYKNFLQDIIDNMDGISEPVEKQIRQALEDTYTVCYNGMAGAVKQSTSDSRLNSLLSGLSATSPETVKNIVENPMENLTLSKILERKRTQTVVSIKKTLTVGLAGGDSYTRMAKRVADTLDGDYKKAIRIVRTESNRAINRSFQDVAEEASELLLRSDYVEVKEWCSMEDESVRDAHKHLNGKKIHALDLFESHGAKASCPGGFGVAAEDINCRCFLSYSLMLRSEFIAQGGVIPDEVLKREKELTSGEDRGIIKMDNKSVRLWYHSHIHNIPNEIDSSLPIEEKAKKAFELRNKYRSEARARMADTKALADLEKNHPNPSFEQLIISKMKRKSMTREEAIKDIYETAVKSNPKYDELAGL